MFKNILGKGQCSSCKADLHAGKLFCAACGRFRWRVFKLHYKRWELLAVFLILCLLGLALISAMPLLLLPDIPKLSETPAKLPPTKTIAPKSVIVTVTKVVLTSTVQPENEPETVPVENKEQEPPNNSSDPDGFIRWYFERVTTERDYPQTWNYLTDRFRKRNSSGDISEYIDWWNSVNRVVVDDIVYEGVVDVTQHYLVSLTFHMKNGKVVSGTYNYYLVYKGSRGYWQFDRP